jgi:hypothetical protein
MLQATAATLAAAGIAERPDTLLADSGYWSIANLTTIHGAPELLIPPAKHARQGKPRKDGKPSACKSDGLRATMKAKLASDEGKACYAASSAADTARPISQTSSRGLMSDSQGRSSVEKPPGGLRARASADPVGFSGKTRSPGRPSLRCHPERTWPPPFDPRPGLLRSDRVHGPHLHPVAAAARP